MVRKDGARVMLHHGLWQSLQTQSSSVTPCSVCSLYCLFASSFCFVFLWFLFNNTNTLDSGPGMFRCHVIITSRAARYVLFSRIVSGRGFSTCRVFPGDRIFQLTVACPECDGSAVKQKLTFVIMPFTAINLRHWSSLKWWINLTKMSMFDQVMVKFISIAKRRFNSVTFYVMCRHKTLC